MNEKNDLIYIIHILNSINAIEEFSKDLSKEDLISDRLHQSAIIREIEIIGEAVKNISIDTKNNYPDIEWKKIAGSRDNVIHRYFNVDLEIIWNILSKKIPILKKQILEIIKELESNKPEKNKQ